MAMRKVTLLAATAFMVVSLTACDNAEEKHAKYINRGNALYEKGEYTKARIEYKNAARLKPSDAEVRYRMGLVDEAEGKMQEAFKNFISAEQQDVHHREVLLKLSQYFLAADKTEEAQKRINTVLQAAPNDPDGHAINAALHLRAQEFDQTEKAARQALAFDPSNVIAHTVLTGLYVAQNNQQKAAAVVEEGIARNPKSVALLLLKAMVYEKSSNVDKIAEAYKVIFNLKPAETRFREELAKAYAQSDKLDDAEKVLRDGVEAMPENWEMKKSLLSFLNEKRGMEAAERVIKDYMAANPDNQDIIFLLADLYIANKATDRAIALLQDIVQRSSEDPKEKHSLNARTSLARIHFVKGDKVLAEKLAQAVLEQDPNNREALFVRAHTLFEQGNFQQAVVTLRTIVRDHPDDAAALQLLGESLLQQGYMDLAVDAFSKLVQVSPTSAPAKVRLAQLYGAQGDHARAIVLLDIVTKYEPDYSVGWESLARLAIDAQNWELAESSVKSLEGIEGQAKTAQFLRGQIAVAKSLNEEAFSHFSQVIEADSSAPIAEHAMRSLFDLYKKLGKLDAAATYYAARDRNNALVLTLLGRCYVGLNKRDEAAKAFDQAIAAQGTDAEPYLSRAQLLRNEKKIDEALVVLEKAEQATTGDLRATIMRADLLSNAGRYQEALVLYEKILTRNPNVEAVANNAAQLIADYMPNDMVALEKARILAERFIRSPSPYFLDTLAWVYFRQGRIEQAQTIFERILASDTPLSAPIYYHYAALLVKSGRSSEAKEFLEKAIQTEEPYTGLEEAKRMLKSL